MIAVLASYTGRICRIIAGGAIFWLGLFTIPGATGVAVMIVGFVPILAGVMDFCLIAPLFGDPFSGYDIREKYAIEW